MTANIHPSNKPYYDAVLDNLRAGREHGLQYKFSGDSIDWRDCEADSLGIPCVGGFGCPLSLKPGTFLLQMKPEEPAREMIKIGALELPKLKFVKLNVEAADSDDAREWGYFLMSVINGDPETIAAITRSEDYVSLADKYDAAADKIVSLQAKINDLRQQREIDRKSFQQAIADLLVEWSKSNLTLGEFVDGVFQALNAKPASYDLSNSESVTAEVTVRVEQAEINKLSQQREINRDDLADKIQSSYNKYFNDGVDFEFCLYAADAVIKHLNAKPVESGELSKVAQNIHYPECWDTVAYPTLMDALREFTCSECANPVAQEPKEDRKKLPEHAKCGISRAEWHDKAWELYHNKTFEDLQLSKVNIHTLRTIFNATYEALNAKPVESNLDRAANIVNQWPQWKRDFKLTPYSGQRRGLEPKELVMPLFDASIDDREFYRKQGAIILCKRNADIFRERGIVVPKELA